MSNYSFKNKDYAICIFEEHMKDHLNRHPYSTVRTALSQPHFVFLMSETEVFIWKRTSRHCVRPIALQRKRQMLKVEKVNISHYTETTVLYLAMLLYICLKYPIICNYAKVSGGMNSIILEKKILLWKVCLYYWIHLNHHFL